MEFRRSTYEGKVRLKRFPINQRQGDGKYEYIIVKK